MLKCFLLQFFIPILKVVFFLEIMQSINNIISRPDTVDFKDALSLGHILIKNLTKTGNKTVLVSGETGEKLSANELLNKSIEISKSLIAAGIKPGDIVTIVSENRFEFIYVLFGTIFLNCPLAPLNHTYSDRELEHSFNLSKPKFVFCKRINNHQCFELGEEFELCKENHFA